jgi:hypothetical protein
MRSRLPATAPAAHAAETPDPAVAAALQRIQNGTWTNADAELIGSIPELAATTPDPRVTPPAKSATSLMKRRIDLCAPGCYATNYRS